MTLQIRKIRMAENSIASFIFEKPAGFSFYPGQYLDVELPVDDPNGKTRAFTISASPTEDFLMLSTKNGITPFKKHLVALKVGDKIKTSHPAGTFTLDEKSPAAMIAGGIGITPFRSMIKYAFDQKLKASITLIYLNSDANFPFKKELDSWKQSLPNLHIIYHNSSLSGHLTKLPTTIYQLPIYYLAGPPKMVDSFERILLGIGVDELNIRYDRFDGYK
ncbi:hypothetical protein A3B45_04155 [Candidatus Daviesbacteria bacterium RIFCSPLOWO2_01_FULL_39_12]|uniref:FAD-binding FR-type domain-containing protein n=1 Tax=Candidatus Daviesbacteria bacterium RIFCSPLOWO2_01_FULL_39_12 TaxID=1797785 RepID=A0A1F5KTG3_9BACT|nr:MAG: hypothetical protein A3B45_04155 [Candidatus Daviesbacteria bacterium RIFCSPLOWO2_01_FULL_39_12]